MPRLVTTLLVTLAMPFLAMGTPLCCVVGASCCHVPPQVEHDDHCPCCPDEPEPDEPLPTPECDCDDHPVVLSRTETAPAPALVLAVAVVMIAEAQPQVLASSLPEAATAPPRACCSALTRPLLL